MTVTSLVAPAAPADSAPADQSNTAGDDRAAGSGFATLLAGLNDRGTAATGAKTGDRNAPGGGKPGAANAPTDPVTLALLGALAGIAAIDPAAGPAPTATAPTATAPTATAPVATAPDLPAPAPIAPAESPTGAAPEFPALATDRALRAPGPTTSASEPALLVPDVVGTTNLVSPTTAVASAVPPLATAPPSPAETETTGSGADSADESSEPSATASGPTATAAAPTSKPAAPTSTPDAATAETVAATTANAGGTPIVQSEPAPKSDTIAENVMITAASAAADYAAAASAAADYAAPATAARAATSPHAPAAPVPPPPSEQLVAVMRPLHRGPDGTYQIRIEMRPPELGRVDLRVEMRDGVLHASIHAERSETAELVRGALDDLRARLDADGVRSGQLTVDAHGAGTPGRDQPAPEPQRIADRATDAPEPTVKTATAPTTTTTSDPSDSLLDVRI